jgi:protein-L-isoaspartate(D-aspartate) O-methyltransferase
VTAAAEDPPVCLAQLKVAVSWCFPMANRTLCRPLIRVSRTETGFEYEELRAVRFVLLEGLGKRQNNAILRKVGQKIHRI